MNPISRTLLSSLILAVVASARAEEAPASAAAGDADELAKKLANPVASMISVPFQNNFDFGGGPNGDGFQWKMNIQPVIPFKLNEHWNLITRTIVPVIHQEDLYGTRLTPSGSQTGLGDTVMSAWLSPVQPSDSGWIWGVGAASLLPTGNSNNFLGTNQWGLGPTAVALKQDGQFTYGFLANHIWNVGGDGGFSRVNASFLQPFFVYLPGGGWSYSINTETSYDWTNDQFTVPINLSVSKMFKIGNTQAQWQLGGRYYIEKAANGPEWGVRASITFLFPE